MVEKLGNCTEVLTKSRYWLFPNGFSPQLNIKGRVPSAQRRTLQNSLQFAWSKPDVIAQILIDIQPSFIRLSANYGGCAAAFMCTSKPRRLLDAFHVEAFQCQRRISGRSISLCSSLYNRKMFAVRLSERNPNTCVCILLGNAPVWLAYQHHDHTCTCEVPQLGAHVDLSAKAPGDKSLANN